ncbi:MAG TPA: redoxin family protein [Vicinamibacterales bacterium]|nr:redoxin family protein [Vicinamibacterales bacterium]
MKRTSIGILLAVALSVGLPALTSATPSVKLRDVDNRVVDPFAPAAGRKAVVLVFVTIDCPISNRYAPIVRQLNDTFAAKGVQFWLVYPNPFDTPDGIRKHLKDYSYKNDALLDPDHALAKLAKASVTPEAAIFDPQGRELYHGRIDDRYVNLALERPAATRHDLEDALNAVVAGKPVVPAPTHDAVGCFISDFVK